MNSVSEQIDERILRLLGLDDVFDLDYDTYLTLLKEAIVAGSDKLPQEELALLANERKRVRGKKGRFKPKKEKITADKIATTKFLKPANKNLVLPESISKPDTSQNLIGFSKPLESIAKTLSAILKFNKKTNEEERKDKESEKRTKREESLEGFKKGVSAISGAARKLLAPFQSIIDRIWRFIFFTLLGRAFTQLMEWLGDPKNKRKIEVLGRFLKDWWPSLAFAAGLFLTPFGKFVRTTIGLVRAFIPQLIKLTTNPAFLAIAGATAGGIAGASLESNIRKVDEKLLQRRIKEAEDKGKPLSKQEIEKIKLDQLQKRIQDVRGTNIPGSALLASGGLVPRFSGGGINPAGNYFSGMFDTGYEGIDRNTGQKVSGFGPDTQAIIAQPGEIVINKPTVDAVGAEHFLGLNRQYGGPGANKPKMGKLYNTGGMVGMQGGGNVNVRAENPRMTSSRDAWNSLNTTRMPLKDSIEEAKSIILNRQALTNTNIKRGGIRPWWDKITNPFRKPFNQSMPNTPIDKFRMPGFNLNRWFELDNFRTRPEEYKSTPSPGNPKSKYAPRYIRPGVDKPLMLQGGGFINGNNITDLESRIDRMINQSLPQTLMDYNQQVEQGQSQPIDPKTFEKELERQKYNTKMKLLRNYLLQQQPIPQKNGGGIIKENTGMDIPGATADRQLVALEPGENHYIIPKGAVQNGAVPLIDQIVAMTDYDSTPAKLGKKPINRPTITPLPRSGMGGMMTLPPITQSAGGSMGSGSAAGSRVPSFSTISPSSGGERSMNASIYGIVG